MAIYVKPGAFSRFTETAGSVILGAGTRIPAIIGESYTYKVAYESITRNSYPSTLIDALANVGVTSVLSVGDFPYSSDYVENTDWKLTGNTIEWIVGGDRPDASAVYYVSYQYSKVAADYNAKLFYSLTDAQAEYGIEQSNNPLATALQIWNENGQFPVIAVQTDGTSVAAYKAAIDKLKYQIDGADATHLIALTTDSEIHSYLYTHVLFMSSMFQRKERRALISTAISTSTASMQAKALAMATERILYVPQWGVRNTFVSGTTYSDLTFDGTYMAIAILGQMLSRGIEESITNKPINGFKSLTKVYLEEEADALAEKGILLLYTTGGVIKVRHDITTSVATPEENQWSVGEIKDYVIKNVRNVLETQWLAKSIYGTETVNNIKITTDATLKKLIEGKILTNYQGITAVQNSTDSRRIDVAFQIEPVYPLIWIYINFGFIK